MFLAKLAKGLLSPSLACTVPKHSTTKLWLLRLVDSHTQSNEFILDPLSNVRLQTTQVWKSFWMANRISGIAHGWHTQQKHRYLHNDSYKLQPSNTGKRARRVQIALEVESLWFPVNSCSHALSPSYRI